MPESATAPPVRQPSTSAPPAGPMGHAPETGIWRRRTLLGLQGLAAEEIRFLLDQARSLADVSTRSVKVVPALRGKVVANLFFEDSTRTRLSFTLAARRLSADVIDLVGAASSVNKGETIADTALNVEAMGVDALIVRHKAAGAAGIAAGAVRCAVLNAGDGKHEHPTQGLLDIYTLAQSHGRMDGWDLRGLRIAIVGDIVSSRVARSNIAGLTALGASVVCVGPPTLAPRSLEVLGCTVEHDFDRLIAAGASDGGLHAVNMLRIQFERHDSGSDGKGDVKVQGVPASRAGTAFPSIREYVQGYSLTRERASRLPAETIVMHPGPMNRGIEIEGAVADGPRSVILKQVTNGLAVRMAALLSCVTAKEAGA